MKKNEFFDLILSKIKSDEPLNIEDIQSKILQSNDFSEVSHLVYNPQSLNAQKIKYYKSLILSKVVQQTVEWFNSEEGSNWMISKRVNWSNEQIGKNIFGWQKSYFYKLLRVSKLNDIVLIEFDKYCESKSDSNYNRSIENLLKFSKIFN